jgi:hypothetical protein
MIYYLERNLMVFLLRCLEKEESKKVLDELHSGDANGNFGGYTTAQKVIRDRYYCPTLFKYSHALSHKYIIYQKTARQVKNTAFPLQPVTIDAPFQRWGLDIIGPINPPSSQ